MQQEIDNQNCYHIWKGIRGNRLIIKNIPKILKRKIVKWLIIVIFCIILQSDITANFYWCIGAPDGYLSCSSGYHIYDGTRINNIRSISECQTTCSRDSSCQAIDYNFMDELCYFHYSNSSCNPMINKAACTHCKTLTCSKFILEINSHISIN